jgi:hypothetical protein
MGTQHWQNIGTICVARDMPVINQNNLRVPSRGQHILPLFLSLRVYTKQFAPLITQSCRLLSLSDDLHTVSYRYLYLPVCLSSASWYRGEHDLVL